jgi:hypothetical protein
VNRPTKLAEQFSELYDNEWTDAFDAITKGQDESINDKEACTKLLNVLTVSQLIVASFNRCIMIFHQFKSFV